MGVAVYLMAFLTEDSQVIAAHPEILLVRKIPGQGLEDDIAGSTVTGQLVLHTLGIFPQVLSGFHFCHSNLFQQVLPQADKLVHTGSRSISRRNTVLNAVDPAAGHLGFRNNVLHIVRPCLRDQVIQGLRFLVVHHGGQVRQSVPVQVDGFVGCQHNLFLVPVSIPAQEPEIHLHVQFCFYFFSKRAVDKLGKRVGLFSGIKNRDFLKFIGLCHQRHSQGQHQRQRQYHS